MALNFGVEIYPNLMLANSTWKPLGEGHYKFFCNYVEFLSRESANNIQCNPASKKYKARS